MTRLLFTAGVARIVVLQLNSLKTPKSIESPMVQNAMYVDHVMRGSVVTREPINYLEE